MDFEEQTERTQLLEARAAYIDAITRLTDSIRKLLIAIARLLTIVFVFILGLTAILVQGLTIEHRPAMHPLPDGTRSSLPHDVPSPIVLALPKWDNEANRPVLTINCTKCHPQYFLGITSSNEYPNPMLPFILLFTLYMTLIVGSVIAYLLELRQRVNQRRRG